MPHYLTYKHIYVPGTKKNLYPQFLFLFVVKWEFEKSGIQDIIIIGINSLTIVHNKMAHILFFVIWNFLFPVDRPFTCTTLFNRPEKSNVFKDWLALWVQRCMLISQELVVTFSMFFDLVALLIVNPVFNVRFHPWKFWKLTIYSNLFYQNLLSWSCFFNNAFPLIYFSLWLIAAIFHTV